MSSPRVVAIIQARMGSSRLPGKVLRLLGGDTVLANVVARVKAAGSVHEIVVATSTSHGDDVLAAEADRLGVKSYRGSESDVLARYQEAAAVTGADVIVRVTSDCPLLDAAVIDKVVGDFLAHIDQCDYASNTLTRTYPRGLDVEVCSRSALEAASTSASSPAEREHVTLFFHNRRDRFRLRGVVDDTSGPTLDHQRWTLDTTEDYTFLQRVFAGCGISPTRMPPFREVASFVEAHPDIAAINAAVPQKVVSGS